MNAVDQILYPDLGRPIRHPRCGVHEDADTGRGGRGPLGPMQGCFAALAYGSGRSGKQRDHGFLRGARFSLLHRGRGPQEKFPIDKLEREWGLAASR